MSIIVQNIDTNELILYSKGADSVILPLLTKKEYRIISKTQDYLNEYAKIGLRTLLLAKRTLNFEEYLTWKKRFDVNIFVFLIKFLLL